MIFLKLGLVHLVPIHWGPWKAAELFLKVLKTNAIFNQVTGLKILLYGLAKTCKGHATDVANLLGLLGEDPVTIDVDRIAEKVLDITTMVSLLLSGEHQINFSVEEDLLYSYHESLEYHPNALTFQAFFKNGSALSETYYSVGG
ncbi:serine dehydratase beta chain [Mucilaginibacter sp. UR6-11]|uniref:serine dehydratase beta chain n=1 Tax=Mucilaginibacter sp. UR6-11 TaxID=1435644 RepID=UPI00351D3EC2